MLQLEKKVEDMEENCFIPGEGTEVFMKATPQRQANCNTETYLKD